MKMMMMLYRFNACLIHTWITWKINMINSYEIASDYLAEEMRWPLLIIPLYIYWLLCHNVLSLGQFLNGVPVFGGIPFMHYNDVIMSAMASQMTSLTIVCSTVYSGADQRKHQSSVSLAFVRGIHRWPMNSPHKGPVTRKIFPFDDVIMGYMYSRPQQSPYFAN